MEQSKQSKRPLKDILFNIEYVVSYDYPRERKRMPTRAIVSSKLFEILEGVNAIIEKPRKKKGAPQRYVFKDFPKIKVFTREEFCRDYDPKLLENSQKMSIPFVIGTHGLVRNFKKLDSYNLDYDNSTLVQALA
jgi:hypothetical protein